MLSQAALESPTRLKYTSETRPDGFSYQKKLAFLSKFKDNDCNPSQTCIDIGIAFTTWWEHYWVNGRYHDGWFYRECESLKKQLGFKIQKVSTNLAQIEKTSTYNDRITSLNMLLPEFFKPERLKLGIFVNQPGNLSVNYVNPTTHEIGNPLRRLQIAPGVNTMAQSIQQSPSLSNPITDAVEIKVDRRSRDHMTPERQEALRQHAKAMREARRLRIEARRGEKGGGAGEG